MQTLYQPLAANEFRLLRIQASDTVEAPIVCTLRIDSLDRNPNMFALSYVWGDPNDTVPISLSGVEFNVTTNLAAALRRIRTSPFGPAISEIDLWVDAICINQDDVNERNQQVKLMGKIYSQAYLVIAFLGETENQSQLAMNIIDEWGENSKGILDPSSDFKPRDHVNLFKPEAWKALGHLFSRPFWHRIWIQQEIALAKEMLINCGPCWIRWDALQSAFWIWRKLEQPFYANIIKAERLKLLADSRYRIMVDSILCRQNRRDGQSADDMLEYLRLFSKKEASDPRDKIYALIGLAGAEDYIVPDYSQPVEEVYIDLARVMIERQQSLRLIYAAEAGNSSSLNLPSWVPDWSGHHVPNSLAGVSMIGLSEKARAYYHAAENTRSAFLLSDEKHILFAGGLICDRLSLKAPFLFRDGLYNEEQRKFLNWFIFGSDNSTYPSGITKLQAFFRTMLIDFDVIGQGRLQTGASTFFDLASAFLCCLGYRHNEDGVIIFQKADTEYDYLAGLLKFLGEPEGSRSPQALVELFLGTSAPYLAEKWTDGNLSRGHHSFWAFVRWCSSVTTGRMLFRTERGYMGLAPAAAREDDLVCVFLGSSVPVLLRRLDFHYVLVGECFVQGLMDGEAMQKFRDGQAILEDFEIH